MDDSLNKSSDENDASVGGDSALWAAFGSSESEGGDWDSDYWLRLRSKNEKQHITFTLYLIKYLHSYSILHNLPEIIYNSILLNTS